MNDGEFCIDEMIAQARRNPAELGRLLNCYRPYLLIVARDQIGPKLAVRCDAEDVVQQTMADVHRGFCGFHGSTEGEFSDWIEKIHGNNLKEALRCHLAAKRALNREKRMECGADEPGIEPPAEQTSPSGRAMKREDALRLAYRLQQLPEAQRDAVRLRYFKGMTCDEIARQMGRSDTAVAGLIKRGLRALREIMSPDSWL